VPVQPSPNLDPIEVAKYAASLAMSPTLAGIVGPYAIIVLASVLGAGAALANRDPLDRGPSFLFFARAVLVALLATVPVATIVAAYFEGWQAQWLFIPGAVMLSYWSDKSKAIFSFVGGQMKLLIQNWVTTKGDGEPK
jgi:hypothetical protein